MNKNYYVLALFICILLLVSSCAKKSGAATGSAPRTPFIGDTSGVVINFEKDSPPPEVTDDSSFGFRAIVNLKNQGEFTIPRDHIKVNLIGFDPADFGHSFEDLRDVTPDDNLQSKKRDAEGNLIDGTTTFAQFPKSGSDFVPSKFPGNTPFTFRADVCYNYQTEAISKICVLKDMINVRDDSICRPTQSKTVYSSSGPVQITNLRESVIGRDKLAFNFDVVLNSNVDIFWTKDKIVPTTFDDGCPRDPRFRRERENQVGVIINEIPIDPIFSNLKCGGLDDGGTGVIRMISGKRTVTCTVDVTPERLDLEKTISITLQYNVLDTKETQVLVKHLATTP